MMKRLVAVIALSAPLAAMSAGPDLGDQRLAIIDDPLRVEFRGAVAAALTSAKIQQTIAIVAPSRGWKVLGETDGRVELTRTASNKHVMRVEIVYDPRGYVIQYLSSTNLLYREIGEGDGQIKAIHKNYNLWIKELAMAVNSSLGVSASITGRKPQATREPRPPSGWTGQRNH
jgi:hypothetical protein